jgi:hypothetical protein
MEGGAPSATTRVSAGSTAASAYSDRSPLRRPGPDHRRLVRVLPQIAVGSLTPRGILVLEPWLTPAKGDSSTTSRAIGSNPPGPSQ